MRMRHELHPIAIAAAGAPVAASSSLAASNVFFNPWQTELVAATNLTATTIRGRSYPLIQQ
jgi:hypothetical protein